MNILDKLKQVDQSKIGNDGLLSQLNKALANYVNKDNLIELDQRNYEKIYNLIEKAFPGALVVESKIEPNVFIEVS